MESNHGTSPESTTKRPQESGIKSVSSRQGMGGEYSRPSNVGAGTASSTRENITSPSGNHSEDRELVSLAGGVPVVDSRRVAKECRVQHQNLRELIETHQTIIEEAFGPVRFETGMGERLPQGGFGKAPRYALLTEDQATFLITLTRNTPQVVAFKVALVKAFAKARQLLEAPASKSLYIEGGWKPMNPLDFAFGGFRTGPAKVEDRFTSLMDNLRERGVSPDVSAKVASDIYISEREQARGEYLENPRAAQEPSEPKPAALNWKDELPSLRQRKVLEHLGIAIPATKGEAYELIKQSRGVKKVPQTTKRKALNPKASKHRKATIATQRRCSEIFSKLIGSRVCPSDVITKRFAKEAGLSRGFVYKVLRDAIKSGAVKASPQSGRKPRNLWIENKEVA